MKKFNTKQAQRHKDTKLFFFASSRLCACYVLNFFTSNVRKKIGSTLIPLLITLSLSGCRPESYLSVHNEYFSHKNLASYYVDTPDPRMLNPPIGQRLIVCWTLPKRFQCIDEFYVDINIQFRNHEQFTQRLYPERLKGTYTYDLMNEAYLTKRGFLAYKIDLVVDGVCIDEWLHQMWTELIQPNEEEEKEDYPTL